MRLESRDELDVVDLVRSLAGFAAALESGVSQVWLTGHLGLQGWRDRGLLRADDTCFTVLRQPLELFVSFANYVVAQVATVPLEPQSLRWAGWLAEAEIKSGSSRADMAKALLLKSSGLVEEMANPMTTYLSSEHERSAVRAYEHALAWNCDMVTMVELADYIHKLGVEDDLPRLNESQPGSLRVEELSPVERARIADRLLEEDLILWGLATS
ncbi:MAG: hypothetical protein JWL79_82 [Frankiales bacterium]|nr:hypothetical protein [Frankiales bacterium]